jgi:hypothetical protein
MIHWENQIILNYFHYIILSRRFLFDDLTYCSLNNIILSLSNLVWRDILNRKIAFLPTCFFLTVLQEKGEIYLMISINYSLIKHKLMFAMSDDSSL